MEDGAIEARTVPSALTNRSGEGRSGECDADVNVDANAITIANAIAIANATGLIADVDALALALALGLAIVPRITRSPRRDRLSGA